MAIIILIGVVLAGCASETIEERVERETAESMLRTYAFDGYPDNFIEIAKRLQKEADEGDPRAQSRLGELYFFGFGVPRDAVERAKWHHRAAIGGNRLSQHFLAQIYLEGDGLEQDYRRALEWYGRAAAQGGEEDRLQEEDRKQYDCLSPKQPAIAEGGRQPSSPAADVEYSGLRSALPQWMESDFDYGILWWRNGCNNEYNRWSLESFFSAANAGHAKSQYMVGVAYLSGRGIPPDRAKAAHWFFKAAWQEHGAARREYCALYRGRETAGADAPPDPGWCKGIRKP
ncbi:MAG: sel1 repeat family protein [Proteobacteria bacterium]|nr:sel1 repeat family protein [Pseudomonadota bacterium]